MKLQQTLDSIRQQLDRTVDQRILARLDRSVAQLQASGIRKRALAVGALAPDFELPNQHGRRLGLRSQLARGPLILVFVRGEFGLDVGEYNGTHNWQVPVSATYVVDQDRRIVLAHVEPDHRVRLEPEETLVALARLRARDPLH